MTTYKIYPPIGVARVGNAPEKFYIGPEVYRGLPTNPDGSPFTEADFRDEQLRLCRQAALFHIYRDGENGPEEVTLATPGVKSITWTAHIANKKASWYTFATNEGQFGYAPNHPLRNAQADDRLKLIIDAGPRQISGACAAPAPFDEATVPPDYVGANFPPSVLYPTEEFITYLGELQTDGEGRLLVLGGYGISGSADPNATIQQYANNDGWWDDTADGPVAAVVELDTGETITVDAGWVIVAPPSYAPQIANLVTLWDTIFDTAVRNSGYAPEIFANSVWNLGPDGYRPNFTTEIQPLLERATLYPWVAAIPPKPHSFDMGRLGAVPEPGQPDENQGLRQWILSFLRAPNEENDIISARGATMMPYLAGDNCLIPDTLTSKYLRLTDTQYFFLSQWANGWFVNEPDATPAPLALTRGVLENCVGGAFSPGIEMTWISRNSAIYHTDDPFRINANLVPQGPLGLGFQPQAMEPGDICRYMAVPWQADFNECSSQPLDGRVIWWWPAQRPEFIYLPPPVQPEALRGLPTPDERMKKQQVPWIGTGFDQKRADFIQFAEDIEMVKYWHGLGFVMEKEVYFDGQNETWFVEVARALPRYFYPDE